MDTIKKELNVPKESAEVVDAVFDLIEDIKAKKDVGAITAENLTSLMKAVDGYEALGDEVKSAERSDLAAYMTKRSLDCFAPTKSEE